MKASFLLLPDGALISYEELPKKFVAPSWLVGSSCSIDYLVYFCPCGLLWEWDVRSYTILIAVFGRARLFLPLLLSFSPRRSPLLETKIGYDC